MQKLKPLTVKEKLEKEHEQICFIDVRSQDEFRSGHAPGSMCLPLDWIESGTVQIPKDKLVILSCQSGTRSAKAKKILQERGYENLTEMEGGFSAWRADNLPINKSHKAIVPVFRQVFLTAGFCTFIGSILGLSVHPYFFGIPLFFGTGLMFAGITGWCGLAFLLERMPWNRVS